MDTVTGKTLDTQLTGRGEHALPIELVLRAGLAAQEVRGHLAAGAELGERTWRYLSFYLLEMDERRLHNDTGHSSTAFYAEARLGLDRRRVAELLSVGRFLANCPLIDAEVRQGRILWSQVLLLARVVVPEHEVAWLERALQLDCRELAQQVRSATRGSAPRKQGTEKGIPPVRFKLGIEIGALLHAKWELIKQTLSGEFGRPVDDREVVDLLAHEFLDYERPEAAAGRVRVPSSQYKLVVRPSGESPADLSALEVEDEIGPLPVDDSESQDPVERNASACIRCDANCVHDADAGEVVVDQKTPAPLRKSVLLRDRNRCRCCGSRRRLMAHHIRYRSMGGPTIAANLISLCVSCHSLVHDGLLVLRGTTAREVRFWDNKGMLLASRHRIVPTASLLRLSAREEAEPGSTSGAPGSPPPSSLPAAADPTSSAHALAAVPAVVDGRWWRARAPALSIGRNGTISYAAHDEADLAIATADEEAREAEALRTRAAAVPLAEAFAGIVGQDPLLERLGYEVVAARRRGVALPHVLFTGPAGTGKSSLAEGLAAAMGTTVVQTVAPVLQDVPSLVRILADLREGDVLFIDEMHAMPRLVMEVLYEAMASRKLSLCLQAGVLTKTVRFDLPAFTLVAATTEQADLPDSLLGRFGLIETLGKYEIEDLATLVVAKAMGMAIDVERAAACILGEAARGTPREAVRLVERTASATGAHESRTVDAEAATRALRCLGYDAEGLWTQERQYMAYLRRQRGPIPLSRLARMLGLPRKTVEHQIEPVLAAKNLLVVTPRGRMAVGQGAADRRMAPMTC